MTRPKQPPKRRRWLRFITQFSLRTLLILTTLAAVGCWWFLRPEAREEELAGKYLMLRRQIRFEAVPERGLPQTDDELDGSRLVNQGAWRVRDEYGDLLIDGRYADDQPHGKWTIYHVNGKKAAQGAVYRGARTGLWRTWDEEGRLRSETTYQAAEFPERTNGRPVGRGFPYPASTIPIVGMITPPLAQAFGGGGPPPAPLWTTSYIAIRHGPAKVWYENGRLRLEGQYEDDLKAGPWTFYDEQGRVTSQGTFRADDRDGTWTVLDAATGKRQTIEYSAGLIRSDQERLLAGLNRQLLEGGTNERIAAARRLEKLGPSAVPCLLAALEHADAEVQLLALRALARQEALPDEAVEKIAGLVQHTDRRVALRAMLAIYLARPGEREALRGRLLRSLESEADEVAIDALLAMCRADPAGRSIVLAPLLARMGRAEANDDGSLASSPSHAGQIADLGWEVVPHLEALFPASNAEARWFMVLVLDELIRRQPRLVKNPSGYIQSRYEIPAAAQPLIDRAKADADPRVRESAAAVGSNGFGGGGFGGGGGMF